MFKLKVADTKFLRDMVTAMEVDIFNHFYPRSNKLVEF